MVPLSPPHPRPPLICSASRHSPSPPPPPALACCPHPQVHPTRKNLLKGNHLRDHLNSTAVPVLHEKWRPDKPICKMIQRLFLHLGLPQNVIDDYSCGHETKRDAWLVGLADPTRAIPEGHVFVTGLPQLRQAFVTRSPTIKASDGRVFPTLAAQPSDMSTKQWRWLCGLPFGGIIFSARGPVPMPSQCAAGDLDGDYYFVLWDEAMVNGLAPGARQAAQDAADEVPATADLAAMPRCALSITPCTLNVEIEIKIGYS